MRQVRAACRLAEECGDRGDDPHSWAGRLLDRLPAVTGGGRWSVAFPAAGVLLVADTNGGPATEAPSDRTRGALAAARENRPGERAGRGIVHSRGHGGRRLWAWTDRQGRTAALICEPADGPAGSSHRLPPALNGRSSHGPPAVGDRLAREVVRRLRRYGLRLTFPGEPAPYDLAPKTREVLCRLLRGESEREIADAVGVTQGAVHKHVHRVHKHFGVGSRGRLLARWLARGWGRTCDWRPAPGDAFGPVQSSASSQ